MAKKKKLHIITYGCQMNQYDSMRMKERLADEYDSVDAAEEADLIIINTCSVREKPENKVYSQLGGLRSLKRKNPDLVVAVAGCVAQQEKEHLLKQAPHLDLVLGPDEEPNLPELIEQVQQGKRLVATRFDPNPFHLQAQSPLPEMGQGGKVSAFLAVQKGCNHFCTYCIVPYVRGREKSRPLAEILDETRRFAEVGIREITLLGQNINGYGTDFENGPDFADLLRAVAEIDGIERIRFVTSHPAAMTDRHLDAMAEVDKVCEYLHLPVQSGSDAVLAAMRRGYTRGEYLDLIQRLKQRIPDLALSGDMIVGFPGETEEDFQQTLDLVREIGYHTLYSFAYSERPGTRAARMVDDVVKEDKLERLARLQALQKELTLAANKRLLGSRQQVLFEGHSKRTNGDLSGRTRCNKIVNVPANSEWLGRFANVRITAAYQNSLRGELELA